MLMSGPLNPEGDIMVIIMIEDTEGVQNINEIIKVPGISAVFFGPGDYSVSSGTFGGDTHEVDEALNTVKDACDSSGIPFVGFADIETIDTKLEENYKMLIIGSDIDKSGRAEKVLEYLRGL